jgi:hypothetical protein
MSGEKYFCVLIIIALISYLHVGYGAALMALLILFPIH